MYAVDGSAYCYAHDPTLAAQRAAARRAGGRARHGRKLGSVGVNVEPVTLATVADILTLLETTANDLNLLENSVNRARAFIALATAATKTIEVSEIEQRLQALEERLNAQS